MNQKTKGISNNLRISFRYAQTAVSLGCKQLLDGVSQQLVGVGQAESTGYAQKEGRKRF